MAVRADGEDTHEKLLVAATQVFGECGYSQATVAEICRIAGANVAAVNYHFGSKEQLYRAVWRRTFERARSGIRAREQDLEGAPPEHRLAERIRGVIRRIAGRGEQPLFARLLTRELIQRTAIFEEVRRETVQPMHRMMSGVIRDILGEGATDQQVLYAQMSVINQCLGVGLQLAQCRFNAENTGGTDAGGALDPSQALAQHLSDDDGVEALIEHIVCFSIAGLHATRDRIAAEREAGGAAAS